jgi:hypothetical protein
VGVSPERGDGAIATAIFDDLVEDVREEVVEWRRHLHRNPEVSYHEEETSRFVYETLESFGDLELSRPTKTGVVARLVGESPGRTLAIRADMDALPIQEENDFEFASRNPGAMHACGHDDHWPALPLPPAHGRGHEHRHRRPRRELRRALHREPRHRRPRRPPRAECLKRFTGLCTKLRKEDCPGFPQRYRRRRSSRPAKALLRSTQE